MKFTGKIILTLTAIFLSVILILIGLIGSYSIQNSQLPLLAPVLVQYQTPESDSVNTETKYYTPGSFTVNNPERQNYNESLIQENSIFTASQSSEYLCPDSSEILIASDYQFPAESPLYDYSIYQMAGWELLAKHGYIFQDTDIQDYFEDKQWYEILPSKSDNFDVVFLRLTQLERENYTFFMRSTS